MPARILYAGQSVTLTTNAGTVKTLPVQSASCDLNIPIEDILSFGHLGSLGRFQNQAASVKGSIKTYIPANTGTLSSSITAAFIQGLTGEALSGAMSTIVVSPNGFTMSGILTSLAIDITNGGFGTCDLNFAGVGEPVFALSPTTSFPTDQASMPSAFSPITSVNVGGQATSGCASSFKFSLDIPTDELSCLGANISGTQGIVSPNILFVAKSPFKASISVEGSAVDLPSAAQMSSQFSVGKIGISLPNAKATSHSFNNSVGSIGAVFAYNLEDVSVNFVDL